MAYDKNVPSVVICTYTEARRAELVAAVISALRQRVPPREVIVVVDYNEPLLAWVQDALPSVRAVANGECRGLSGARNAGVQAAGGSMIAFLDDDVIATSDWLERLIVPLADRRALGVGGAVLPFWHTGRPHWFPEEFDWVVGCTYRGLPPSGGPVRNPIGANMCLRREVWEACGGFRIGVGRIGTYPLGCEETELCVRARHHWPDGEFLYEPTAVVYHNVPESRARWSYFRARCYAEGISKARLARLVGREHGLASERAHVLRMLPRGIVRGMADAAIRRDWSGLARASAIVAGLAITTMGYAAGAFHERSAGGWCLDPRPGFPKTGPEALSAGRTGRMRA